MSSLSADLPSEVQPGDIISSELMTLILARLADLSDAVLTGTQTVPGVIGMLLADATSVIQAPSGQLSLGFVVDITGATLSPTSPGNANLIVLNQSPVAGTRVAVNAPVNLVVSQVAGSTTPGTGPQPAITATETLEGVQESDFPVGGTVVIVGSNFNANPAQNIVTFDGVAALVNSDQADPTRRLLVTVPAGIPGAPVAAGDPTRFAVPVLLRNAQNNRSASTQINVIAPVADAPTISSVAPSTALEGTDITITGSNFSDAAQVLIRDQPATLVSVSGGGTQIVATVPNFADVQQNAIVTASIIVTIPDVGSVPFNGTFLVVGIADA